ncbi:MAG: MAPEG family protein [Pseudomonadota bacterium]
MEGFAEYGHAIASLAGLVLLWGVLNPLSAFKKQSVVDAPGSEVIADYRDPVYRWHRAHGNLTETMPFFASAVLAAMLVDASAFWVNLLASLFLLTRIGMTIVHINAIGPALNGPRSFLYIAGWAMIVALAVLAIVGAF